MKKYKKGDVIEGTVKEELVKPLSEDMKRIENDVSFNYSATEFKFESQKRKKK